MASRLASNLTEDYLTCSICCELYEDPRQLPCDHSFCLKCTLDYGRKFVGTKKISCPICRDETSCPPGTDFLEWIKALPVDYLLVAILKTVTDHDQKSTTSGSLNYNLFEESENQRKHSTCAKHISQIQDVYCFTHALLVCSECAWLEHGQCQCFPLDDCSEKITEKIKDLKVRLDHISRQALEITKNGEKSKHKIKESTTKSQASLHEIQTTLQQFWGRAQCSLQRIAQNIHERDRDITGSLRSVSDIQDDIMQLTHNLGNANQTGNNLETLKLLQESDRKAREHGKRLNEISFIVENTAVFKLDKNAELLQFCRDCREVGHLKSETQCNAQLIDAEPSRTLEYQQPEVRWHHMEPEVENASASTDSQRNSVTSDTLFEKISHRVIHVDDNNRGIYTLPDVSIVGNYIIIVDQYNSLVMKFDQNDGTCLEKVTILEPHHVGQIPGSTSIMITCWSQNEIYTLDVEPKLKVTGQPLSTAKHYIGIHVYDRYRILVSALDKSIDIINFKGHVLHSIHQRQQANVFSGLLSGGAILLPADLCMLSEDAILVFDGVRKSLVAMSLSGKIKWTKHFNGLSGFAVFGETIFVCDGKSNIIMTLTKEGKMKDRHFLSRFVGIKRPWAIDVRNDLIVVTEDAPSGKFHIINLDTEETCCMKLVKD